jgi:hypothetical protein
MGAVKRLVLTGIFLALAEYCLGQVKVEMGVGTVYNLSRKESEKQLAKLSKKAWKEDSWIWYDNKLIDNGKNETDSSVMFHSPTLIRTGNKITDTIYVLPGDTAWAYHIHPDKSLPGIKDIVNQSMLMDSIYTNEYLVQGVATNGKIWDFNVGDSLRKEFHGKSSEERFKLLEYKINIAYTPENAYKFGGHYPYPYKLNPKDRKHKEYRDIMKQVGVDVRCRRPGKF